VDTKKGSRKGRIFLSLKTPNIIEKRGKVCHGEKSVVWLSKTKLKKGGKKEEKNKKKNQGNGVG